MAKYGLDVPAELTRTDKASMVYFRFIQELAGAQKKRITELLRRINPELAYCSVDYVRQESNSEFGRELPHWQYQASSNARAIRGMGQEADVADVDFMGFAYRHASVNPAFQELRLWQTLANYGGLDYYVMGRLYDKEDKSAWPRVQKVFRYAAEHEEVCYGVTSADDTLLVREAFLQFVLTRLCPCRSVSENLHPSVEVTHGCKEGFKVVHFGNGSGHFGNSFFDPAILSDQSIMIPWEKGSAFCENLDEPGNVRWVLNGNELTITIPKLGAHACVVIQE